MPLIASYESSYALIIGINKYLYAPPLGYAVSDAESVSHILHERFAFPKQNITLLIDEDATRDNILKKFMFFTSDSIDENDRIFVFFAGHGFTTKSRRSDVGFLVPQDGNVHELGSLIRWDELTRNSDLIQAKHILFVMDACYGGLAITRALKPGAMRFLKDMLVRPSRQVITAGKADEVVADLGGPRPDHSVFTGHFLDALDGNAADVEGVITANGIMNYVYRKVGQDQDSYQTPHFGYLDGDGDFIFSAPILSKLRENDQEDTDILLAVNSPVIKEDIAESMDAIEKTKEYLSNSVYRIKLHDLVVETTRTISSKLSSEDFSLHTRWSIDEFSARLDKYQMIMSDLLPVSSLIGYWGKNDYKETMCIPFRKLAGELKDSSGLSIWLSLRWYPILLLSYSVGISAIAGNNYENLSAYFGTQLSKSLLMSERTVMDGLYGSIGGIHEAIKQLPGHERQFVPVSEYLYKYFQPVLDDLLFLGNEYESTFDRFEIFVALEYGYERIKKNQMFWAPIGRYGWKSRYGDNSSPLHLLIAEGKSAGEEWAPLKAGLLGGSFANFEQSSTELLRLISQRSWM